MIKEKEIQDMNPTEQVLFRTMRKVQRDRMEHAKAEVFSYGRKQEDHKRKKGSGHGQGIGLGGCLERVGALGQIQDLGMGGIKKTVCARYRPGGGSRRQKKSFR